MQEVGTMREPVEEFVVRLAARPVVKFAVVASTGTKTSVTSALVATMPQQLTGMSGRVRGSMASKKLASPGLAIGVAASYHYSSFRCSCCYPCCITCLGAGQYGLQETRIPR